ncbi:hypothetical protein L873DRAFT_1686634 [Choiromyces venosus 120613-1]|uniref:Uncharacterized protein n=1 Tax=Choiromyces venosus 120613-1 TaxID=1336337 RepID=A0A3N4JKI4_9PEZI|nr:hypothetical protein L873DRAFT_1686634 [Choiromyces venosus 120613-1]
MSITTKKGSVYWLDDTPGSQGASVDNGKLNHPVLVLGAVNAGIVQVLLITSFNNQSLSTRFPKPGDTRRRKRYLPLRGGPGADAPHPDNGLLLSIITTGQPAMLSRQSFVNLEPFTVEVCHLSYLHRSSTCILPSDMLDLVIEKLREFKPNFTAYQERSLPPSRPRTQQQSARPHPRPVPQPQPRPVPQIQPPPTTRPATIPPARPATIPPARPATIPPTRPAAIPAAIPAVRLPPPPHTQQRPLPVPPQPREPSSYYSATTARQSPWGPDLERNAQPPQPSSYYTWNRQEDDHDDDPSSDCSLWLDISKYMAIAATVFLSVRYFFR